MPKKICSFCNDTLTETCRFVKTVQDVDSQLRVTVKITTSCTDQAELKSNEDNIETGEKSDDYSSTPEPNPSQSDFKSYTCSICLESFARLADFHSHKKKHKDLNCTECNIVFDNLNAKTDHISTKHTATVNENAEKDDEPGN